METIVTVTQALANYFNEGDAKRSPREFLTELKALEPSEKLELARGVCFVTGWTLKA
jgi:hypothetical protein